MKKNKILAILLVVALILPFVSVNNVSAEDDSSRPYIVDYTYEYDSIPTRHIYSDDLYNLKYTVDGNESILTVDESTGTISELHCDANGTVWIRVKLNLYFYSYELQKDDFTFYCFDTGFLNVNDSEYSFAATYSSGGKDIPLPTLEELQVLLDSNTLTALPTVDLTPSAEPSIAPSEAPSSAPTVAPSESPSVVPSVAPTVVPSDSPNATTNVSTETQSPKATVAPAKVTTTGNKLKLVGTDGTVSQTVTFNKKKATLTYNGVKVKSVKRVAFSKKGTVVYVKKNGNAYYLQGKKSRRIAKKVTSIKKNSNGFAVKLVTKSGKKIKLSK